MFLSIIVMYALLENFTKQKLSFVAKPKLHKDLKLKMSDIPYQIGNF